MYDKEKRAFIAINEKEEVCMLPKMANRHGLITGATGTGKTVTLQNLAETFSQMGVPVFAADVKGDLSGVFATGGNKESVTKRVESYKLVDKGFEFQTFPVEFWDVYGEQGTPIKATISDMGPLLMSRLLTLNDTQTAVLTVLFKIANDNGWEVIDIKDLKKLIEYVSQNTNNFTSVYGNISTASLGAIQRGLVAMEHDNVDKFFGEPDLNIDDLIQSNGQKGVINILTADKLINNPRVYSTFLLWLMSKLFTVLPEVGDAEKPKLVFFFDEAHLLFNDAPKVLLEKIEQVVRLIRSKGVGIYFISQSPSDIPDSVLGQLGNRIQHALRAYTPKDQKAVKVAAQSFRSNPNFNTETAITELGTGEALLSFLDNKGAPQPVERAYILPPQGQIGPLSKDIRNQILQNSVLNRHYSQVINRKSAYDSIEELMNNNSSEKDVVKQAKEEAKIQKKEEKARLTEEKQEKKEAEKRQKFFVDLASSFLKPIARNIANSLFKSNSKKRK